MGKDVSDAKVLKSYQTTKQVAEKIAMATTKIMVYMFKPMILDIKSFAAQEFVCTFAGRLQHNGMRGFKK